VASNREAEGLGIILDYLVERDHVSRALQQIHRVRIIFEALGLEMPETLDWSMDLGELPALDTGFGRDDFVVFQPKGSGKKKSLDDYTIKYIIDKFQNSTMNVVVIGEGVERLVSSSQSVAIRGRQLPLPSLFSLIAKAKALVCMDSAPLWISHFTKTPVVALLGPSRPSERLTLHPLYPEGAVAVRLNEALGCESCFEMAKECEGRIDCLHIPKEQIWEGIRGKLMKFLEV